MGYSLEARSLKSYMREVRGEYMWASLIIVIVHHQFNWGERSRGAFMHEWLTKELLDPHPIYEDYKMEYATAFYVAEPYAEIYVFVDEPPSDLPETAVKIVDEKDPEVFLAALQPYFVMAADS